MRYALSDIPLVKRALRSRWFPWILTMVTLFGFVLAILAGFFGTRAGNRNFGIVFVWIIWWALLILLLLPFAGRLWCAMCPIPAPGEWLQRRALVQPRPGARLYTLGRKWPRRLRNIWVQNVGFLMIALFSVVILTSPGVTALVLVLFAVMALGTSLIFERRTFCRYLCPVGGFIGLYSQVAPVEIRVKDAAVCIGHKEKTCYTGSDAGYGCPWLLFPGGLQANTFCGLCTECLKTCPKDNLALFLRLPGTDLLRSRGHRLDEAYKGFIMLASALIYAAVLIGPWGFLKETARAVGSAAWFAYAFVFLALSLAVLPGLFWLAVRLGQGRRQMRVRVLFADYATALVPLGLTAWMAFSLSFVLANLSYVWPVLSDPFGWGWNLLGTATWAWTPYLSGLVPYLQMFLLLSGLAAAVAVALRTAHQHGQPPRAALPVVVFCTAVTLGFVGLYVA